MIPIVKSALSVDATQTLNKPINMEKRTQHLQIIYITICSLSVETHQIHLNPLVLLQHFFLIHKAFFSPYTSAIKFSQDTYIKRKKKRLID